MDSSNNKRCDLFAYIRINLQLAAMYPIHLDMMFPRNLRFVGVVIEWTFEMFLYLVPIHIVILYLCTIYLNIHSGDLELLVTCMLHTIIYMWTIIMKLYFRRIRPHLLDELMNSVNSEYRTRSAIGLTYVTMDECLAMPNKWFKTYFCWCFSGTILWLVQPFAYGDRSLPLSCWYPLDYKAPIIYESIYFLQSVAQLQVSAAFCGSSGFHMVLAILISGQYDILFCSLKNIVTTVAVRMRLSKDEFRRLFKFQEYSVPEPNEYYCSQELECSISTILMYTTMYGNPLNALQNFPQNFRQTLRTCIEHHRYLLNCLSKMEKFYSPIWFLKTGEVIILMCLVAFVSVKSTTANSSFMKAVSLGQYLLLVALEFLVICYFGEIVCLNSQRCDEAILRSPWYLHMREMKMDFLIFLVNSYRPFRLTAGKLYPLNLDCFRSVMTTAFSFLTFLQTMDEKN